MGQSCGLCKFGPDRSYKTFVGSPTFCRDEIQKGTRSGWPGVLSRKTGEELERRLRLRFIYLCSLLLGQNLPTILERKSRNLLPPESEPTFSIVMNNWKGCHSICRIVHPILVSQNLLFSIIVLISLLMFGTLEEAAHVKKALGLS